MSKENEIKNLLQCNYNLLELRHERESSGQLRWHVKIKCDKGHITDYRYRGSIKCSTCNFKEREIKKRISDIDIQLYMNEHASGYVLINSFITDDNKFKIKLQCNMSHEYDILWNDFKTNRHRCATCYYTTGNNRVNIEISEHFNNSVEGYNLLNIFRKETKYDKKSIYIRVECNRKHEYEVYWGHFKGSSRHKPRRCPVCDSSSGEAAVEQSLNNLSINFIKEFRFDDCRHKYPLPFDFAVLKNGVPTVLIEYDGQQHFSPVSFSNDKTLKYTIDSFRGVKIRDRIKTKYCEDNNLKLIRIPYWEFDNINYIISKELGIWNDETV